MAWRKVLNSLGIIDRHIDKYIDECELVIADDEIFSMGEKLYVEVMKSILKNNLSLFDDFINYAVNDSLKNYFIFLKYILEHRGEEANNLLSKIISDKEFTSEYEEIYLYVSIIMEYELKDLYIPNEEDELIASIITVFKKYLLNFNYAMAKEVLVKIMSIHDCLEYRLIDAILEDKEDTVRYILEPGIYPSKVTNDNLKHWERKALLFLEENNLGEFINQMNLINSVYVNQDRRFYQVINTMLQAIANLSKNRSQTGGRSLFTFHGDFISVLMTLLSVSDYYRVHDLIEEEIRKSEGFDVFLYMLFILVHKIMELVDRNRKIVDCRLDLKVKDKIDDMLPDRSLMVEIKGEKFKECEEEIRGNEEKDQNYYSKYLKCFDEGDYKQARRCLEYLSQTEYLKDKVDIDYLFKELDCLDRYDKNNSEVFRRVRLLFEEFDYEGALKILDKEDADYPLTILYKARCLYHLKRYEEAIYYYGLARNNYLYPCDYECLICALCYLGRYKEVFNNYMRFKEYDRMSLKTYYVMSVAAMKLGDYNKAEDFLISYMEEAQEEHMMIPDLDYEWDVLEKKKKGEKTNDYDMDDYIELGLIDSDNEISKDIQEYIREYQGDYITAILIYVQSARLSIEEKIEYLLSVIRVIKNTMMGGKCDKLFHEVEELLASKKIDEIIRRRLTLTKKNYENL